MCLQAVPARRPNPSRSGIRSYRPQGVGMPVRDVYESKRFVIFDSKNRLRRRAPGLRPTFAVLFAEYIFGIYLTRRTGYAAADRAYARRSLFFSSNIIRIFVPAHLKPYAYEEITAFRFFDFNGTVHARKAPVHTYKKRYFYSGR